MFLNKPTYSYTAPLFVSTVVEIQKDTGKIKYELDKLTYNLKVDRFLHLPLVYPCNYGFIPNTLGEDGDPLDVLIVTENKLEKKTLIEIKPLFVLKMTDESGKDDKIIGVPVNDNTTTNVKKLIEKIKFFFTTYKTNDKMRWVTFTGIGTKKEAEDLIVQSIKRNITNKMQYFLRKSK